MKIPIVATENGRGVVYNASLDYKALGQEGLRVDGIEDLTEQQQESLRHVRRIAEQIVGNLFPRGIIISFDRPIYQINGHSWEVMLCLGMISLRTGIPLRPDITGSASVEAVNKISPIGYLEEKASSAKRAGYSRFIVSPEQDTTGINGIQFIKPATVYGAWFQAVGV